MSYKRRKVMQALARYRVTVLREGGRHTVVVGADGKTSAVPRHAELDRNLVRKIAIQLGLDADTLLTEVK